MGASKGFELLISSLREARTRLANLEQMERVRSADEIWETYCDIEQAIEISKHVFGLNDRVGRVRSLRASAKNDPAFLPKDELIRNYRIADSSLSSAIQEFESGNKEDGIEFARRARDVLKTLLLGIRKREKANKS